MDNTVSKKEEEKALKYPPGFEPQESDSAAAMKEDEKNVKQETEIEKESMESDNRETSTKLSVAEDRGGDGSQAKVKSVDVKKPFGLKSQLITVDVKSKIAAFEKQEKSKPKDNRQTVPLIEDNYLDEMEQSVARKIQENVESVNDQRKTNDSPKSEESTVDIDDKVVEKESGFDEQLKPNSNDIGQIQKRVEVIDENILDENSDKSVKEATEKQEKLQLKDNEPRQAVPLLDNSFLDGMEPSLAQQVQENVESVNDLMKATNGSKSQSSTVDEKFVKNAINEQSKPKASDDDNFLDESCDKSVKEANEKQETSMLKDNEPRQAVPLLDDNYLNEMEPSVAREIQENVESVKAYGGPKFLADTVDVEKESGIDTTEQSKPKTINISQIQKQVEVVDDKFLDESYDKSVKETNEKQEKSKPKDNEPYQAAPLLDDNFLNDIEPTQKIQENVESVNDQRKASVCSKFNADTVDVEKESGFDATEQSKSNTSDISQIQKRAEDQLLDKNCDISVKEDTVNSKAGQMQPPLLDDNHLNEMEPSVARKIQENVESVNDQMKSEENIVNLDDKNAKKDAINEQTKPKSSECADDKVQIDENTVSSKTEQHSIQSSAEASCAINNPAHDQGKNIAAAKTQFAEKKEAGENRIQEGVIFVPFCRTLLPTDQFQGLEKAVVANKVQVDESTVAAANEQLPTQPSACAIKDPANDQSKGNVVATEKVQSDENDATKNGQFSTPFSCANAAHHDTVEEKLVENNDQLNIENKTIQRQKEKEESKLLDAPPGFDQSSENQQQQLPPADAYPEEEEDLDATLPLENLEDGEIPSDELPTNEQELIEAAAAAARETAMKNQAFNAAFDEFCTKFLETDPSNLNEKDIKNFAEKIPADFVVSEERFPPLFKVLFKIKEAQNKTIIDETLALLKKLFKNLDYNKFLLGFWSADRESEGPLGYSYTENRAVFDFTGIFPRDYNDATKVNAKVGDVAWSLLLFPEATVTALLEGCVNNRMLPDFYHTVIRKFKCLGEYMFKAENEEVPLILFIFRKLFADSDSMKLLNALSTLIAVCKSPKGEDQCCAVKPNTVIHELMTNLVRDDSKQSTYTTALRRFFTTSPGLDCIVEWNHGSSGYDNPSKFLICFIKYYNRKQSEIANNDIFSIFNGFKASLNQSGVELENVEEFEAGAEIDWPFVYKVFKFLDVENSKLPIPSSLYMILPEEEIENFSHSPEADPSIAKALKELFELFFVCGNLVEIPDAFYRDLWKTYPCTKPIVEALAAALIEAHSNLKHSINIELRDHICEFIAKLYQSYFDQDFVRSATMGFGMDCEFIISNSHLLVLGRALRLIVDDHFQAVGKKPSFTSISSLFAEIFSLFDTKCWSKFQEIRSDSQGTWPPWRNGPGARMGDAKSMALNYLINELQKEIFCVFDMSWGPSENFIKNLYYLARQRRFFGLYNPRIDELLRAKHPELFESPPPRRPRYGDDGDRYDGQGRDQGQSNYQQHDQGQSGYPSHYGNESNDFQQPQQRQYGSGRNIFSSGRGGGGFDGGRGRSDSNQHQEHYQNNSVRGRYSSNRGGYQNDFQSNRGGGRENYSNVNNDQREEEPQQYQSARGGFDSGRGGNEGGYNNQNQQQDEYNDDRQQQSYQNPRGGGVSSGDHSGRGGGRGSYNSQNQQQDGYINERQQSYQNPRGGASSTDRGGYGRGDGGGRGGYDNQDGYNDESQQQQSYQNPRGGGVSSGDRGSYNNQNNHQRTNEYNDEPQQQQQPYQNGTSSGDGGFGGGRGPDDFDESQQYQKNSGRDGYSSGGYQNGGYPSNERNGNNRGDYGNQYNDQLIDNPQHYQNTRGGYDGGGYNNHGHQQPYEENNHHQQYNNDGRGGYSSFDRGGNVNRENYSNNGGDFNYTPPNSRLQEEEERGQDRAYSGGYRGYNGSNNYQDSSSSRSGYRGYH